MNNIFDFAPKELAQDAFLCWCFNFGSSEIIEEKEFTYKLVKQIYALCGGKRDLDIKEVKPLRQQTKSKIDVVIDITLADEEKVYLIFENKLETSHHSNQLERHVKETKEYPGEKKYIYFKIGHMYQEDLLLPEEVREVYTIIDRNSILNIFTENNLNNDIFNSYYEYLINMDKNYEAEEKLIKENRQLEDDELEKIFYSQSGQYSILNGLNNKLGAEIKLAKGTSFGRPWSNLPLIWVEREGYWFGLFWRIDWRKNKKEWMPYICLRKYKEVIETMEEDNRCFYGMREIFQKLSLEYQTLEFSKVHNSGKKEREIGILFFDNEKNTIPNIINELASFTKKFIMKVNEKELFYEKIQEL